MEIAASTVGLIVDGVTGVLRLPAASIDLPSDLVSAVDENHILGVGKAGDTLVILLNVESILSRVAT